MRILHTFILLLLADGIMPVNAVDAQYPSIHQAISTLNDTKASLEQGEHGFGGHRSAAIEHIDAALLELQLALDYAHDHPDKIIAPQAKP